MQRVLVYIGLVSIMFSQDFRPSNLSTLSKTQILFNWPQVPNADSYVLTITDLSTGLSDTIIDSFRLSIYSDLTWGKSYRWQVCGNNEDNLIFCFDSLYFSIADLPNNFPNNISLIELNENEYTPGLNLIDFRDIGFSAALDKNGEPIWFSDVDENVKFCVIQMFPNGNIGGTGWEGQFYNSGYEVELNGEIIFDTPIDGLHHDFIKTSTETYFGLFKIFATLPSPPECAGCEDMILWRGDKVIEFDQDGNTIWEWNMFDHIPIEEYNPYDASHWNGTYLDWSHTNSVHYDELENTIYLSIRNISRIIKIDYESGEIIWSMGDQNFMLDPDFPDEINNSRQHNAIKIENGNILFFDNGAHKSPQYSRCVEVEINEETPSAVVVWEYVLPNYMFTSSNAECDRLENGHTLISTGSSGNLLEINENDEIVWHVNVKLNSALVKIMRNERIPNLYPSAFSILIHALTGDIADPRVVVDSTFVVEMSLINHGWVKDTFSLYIDNIDNEDTFIGSILVQANSTAILSVNLLDIDLTSPMIELILISENTPNDPLNAEFRIVCDGSIPDCIGCMDPEALNYNPDAVIPDSCDYLNSIDDSVLGSNGFSLGSIFPNPFNPTTTIRFNIGVGTTGLLTLQVYDITGQVVETLINDIVEVGQHEIQWNANQYPSGIYFVELKSAGKSETRKIIYLK